MARLKKAPPLAMLAAAMIVAEVSAIGRNGGRWSPPVPDLDSATSEWVPLSAQPRATEPQAFFAPPPPQFQLHQVPFGQPQLTNQHNQFQQQTAQLYPQTQFHGQPQLQQTPSFPPPQISQQSQFQHQPPRQQPNNHHFLHQVGIPQNLQHFILTPPKQDFPVPNIQQVLFAPPPPPSPPQPPQHSSLPSLPPLPRLPQLQQRPVGVQHPPMPPPPPPPPPPSPSPAPSPNPNLQREKEEVQLLYVPVETLRQRGRLPHISPPAPQPPTTPPPPPTSTPTPHQPPLSVYMGPGGEEAKITDVLQLLKDARTIPVLDQVGPDAPQVFVGPAGLHPPPGYAKFELPYLSSLDSNRIERKVNRLPFFVAPLSFQPPNGYSKILLPPPHIGSVVVSNSTSPTPTPVFVSSTTPLPQPSTESSSSSGHGVFNLPSQVTPVNPRLPTLVNSLEDTAANAQGTPQQLRHGSPQRGRKRPRPQQSLQEPSTERVFVQSTSSAPLTPSPTQTPSSTPLPPVFSTQEPQDVRITPTDGLFGPSTDRSLRVHQANELHSFIQAAQQEQVDQFHHVTKQPFQQITSPQSLEQFPQVTTQQPFRQPQGQFFQSTLSPFNQGQFFDFNQRPQGDNPFVPPNSNEQTPPQNQFRQQHHFVQFPQTEHIFSTPVTTPDSIPQFRPKQVLGQEPFVPPSNQFREEQNQFSRPPENIDSNRNHLRQPEQQTEQDEETPPPQDQFESARNQLRQPHEQGQTRFRNPQEQQQHRFAPVQQIFETSFIPSQEPRQEQPAQSELPSPSPTPANAPTPDPTPALVQVRGRIQGVQDVAVLPQVPIELQRPPHHRQRVQSQSQLETSTTTQPTPSSSLPTRRRSRPRPTQNTPPQAQGVTNDPLAVRFTGKIRNRTRNHQQFIQRLQQQDEEQRQQQDQHQQSNAVSAPVPTQGGLSETTPIPASTVDDETFGQRSTIEEQPTTRAIPTRKYSNFVRTGARRPTATEGPETTTSISGRSRAAASSRRPPFKANRGRIRARTTTPSSATDEVVPTQPPFARRRLTTEIPETANEVPDSEEQESVLPPHSALQSTAERHQSVVQQSVDESDNIPTEKAVQWGDKSQVPNEPAIEIVQSSPIASTSFDWSAHAGSQLSNGWTADRSSAEPVPPIRYDGLGIPSVVGNPVDAPPSDHSVADADLPTTTAEPPLKEGSKKALVGKKRGSWVRVRVKRPRGGAGSDADGLATAESQNSGVASGNALLSQPLTPSPLIDVETPASPITTTTPSSPTSPAPTVIPISSEVPPTSTSYDVELDSTSTPEPFIAEEALTTDQPYSTLPPPANSPFVGTSTSTKVSMETEICYRGRCIKTQTQSGQA